MNSDNLNDQAANTLCQLITAAMDIYNMPISEKPALQFVGMPIQLIVTPMDQANRTIPDLIGSFPPPVQCLATLASKFKAEVTFGKASSFTYDGYGNFISDITSSTPGDGVANVLFDGNMIKTVTKSDDPAVTPTITDSSVAYTFIGLAPSGVPGIRRDETDTANNNG